MNVMFLFVYPYRTDAGIWKYDIYGLCRGKYMIRRGGVGQWKPVTNVKKTLPSWIDVKFAEKEWGDYLESQE